MAEVKHVIFDLGRVLIDFDHLLAAKKIAPLTKRAPQEIFGLFFDSKLTRRFEEGRIGPEEFFGKVKRILRLKIAYGKFLPIWNEIFFLSEHNRQVYALAKRLRKGYTVSLLSNVNVLHLEHIRKNFPIFDAFHHVFASCELGCMKPDPHIYALVLKALGARPAEVFYTDDRAELIEQARVMGMRAYVYTGVEQLKKDLTRCGIALPDGDAAPRVTSPA